MTLSEPGLRWAPAGDTTPAREGWAAAARLGPLLAVALVAQAVLAPRLAPPGAVPDLLLLVTAVVAAASAPGTAVVFGFTAGLAADLLVTTPFGLSAAAFTAVAHAGSAFPVPGRALLVGPRVALSALLAGALVAWGAASVGAGPAPDGAALGMALRSSLTAAALGPPLLVVLWRLGQCRPGPVA